MNKPVIEPEDVVFKSRLWHTIESVLTGEVDYIRGRLETCSAEELLGYQAQLKLLKQLLNLPVTRELLRDEKRTKGDI